MLERQVAQGAIRERSGEVILRCDRHGLKDHSAVGSAICHQHLFGAIDQLAVNQRVAHVEGKRLEAAGVGQQLEGVSVAVPEHQRRSLVCVGDARQSRVVRRVVDSSESEIDSRDLTDVGVDHKSATAASYLVANTIDVVVDGDRTEACRHRRISNTSAGSNSLT